MPVSESVKHVQDGRREGGVKKINRFDLLIEMVEANTPGDFLRTNFALAPLSHGGENVVAVVEEERGRGRTVEKPTTPTIRSRTNILCAALKRKLSWLHVNHPTKCANPDRRRVSIPGHAHSLAHLTS